MEVHRDILIALTWSLGSSFCVLSVLSVPYVVWQDVLLLPWLETPFHMCSQNPEPSAKPHLLAEGTGQCHKDTLPYNSTATTFPQLSHRAVLRCITALLSNLNNARIKLGGNVTCEGCWWKQRDRGRPRQTCGRLRRKESKCCGSGLLTLSFECLMPWQKNDFQDSTQPPQREKLLGYNLWLLLSPTSIIYRWAILMRLIKISRSEIKRVCKLFHLAKLNVTPISQH